jgi:hypothetical protein
VKVEELKGVLGQKIQAQDDVITAQLKRLDEGKDKRGKSRMKFISRLYFLNLSQALFSVNVAYRYFFFIATRHKFKRIKLLRLW